MRSIILALLKQTHISFLKTALTFIAKLMQRKKNTLLLHFFLIRLFYKLHLQIYLSLLVHLRPIQVKIKHSFKLHLNMLFIPLSVNLSHPFSEIMLINVNQNDLFGMNGNRSPSKHYAPTGSSSFALSTSPSSCIMWYVRMCSNISHSPTKKEPELINMAEYISKCRT